MLPPLLIVGPAICCYDKATRAVKVDADALLFGCQGGIQESVDDLGFPVAILESDLVT
jgi:hypothetical protein